MNLSYTTSLSMHSVTNHLTRPAIAFMLPTQRDRLPGDRADGFALSVSRSGLRRSPEGSSLRPAESVLLSCGLHVRLRLLPTPPRDDAVTFGYRERASPGRGLAPLCVHRFPGAPGAVREPPLRVPPRGRNAPTGRMSTEESVAVISSD